jgi:glucosamine-phosphate N-acetyltransferase
MKACRETYYITVIEDVTQGVVIGAATLVIEQKFIHSCACVRIFLLILSLIERI